MRIALVHSFYRSEAPSGENVVVLRQAEALERAGHDVLLVNRHSDEGSRAPGYSVKSALSVATGFGPSPLVELRQFNPDIVHVHNLFPNFGERWLDSWDGPVVVTLHNFRPMCASALLFRDGQVCTLCPDGERWASIKYACYRNSRAATLPLAIHNAGGIARNRLIRRADRIIVLSERSRAAYLTAGDGTLRTKFVVIPNGIDDRRAGPRPRPRHWAFVGRLSAEKGIKELVNAWPDSELLRIVGDGPLTEEIRSLGRSQVSFEGALPACRVDDTLRSSWGLVFPSRSIETGGPPLVVGEAAMHGIPILARAGTSGADFVERTGSGLLYADESDILQRLQTIRGRLEEFSAASRRAYLRELSIGAWLSKLEHVYASAITERATGR